MLTNRKMVVRSFLLQESCRNKDASQRGFCILVDKVWRREGSEQNLQIVLKLSREGNGMENMDPWFLLWLCAGGAVTKVQRVAAGRGWHVLGCLMEAAFLG